MTRNRRLLLSLQGLAIVGALFSLHGIADAAPGALCVYKLGAKLDPGWVFQWQGGCPVMTCDENSAECVRETQDFMGLTWAFCICGSEFPNLCTLCYSGLEQAGALGQATCASSGCGPSCDMHFGAPGPGGWMSVSCPCDN